MVVSCCLPIVDPPEWFPTATEVWVAVVARVGGVPAKQLGRGGMQGGLGPRWGGSYLVV